MGKTFKIQKQIRDNAKTLRFYMTDLQNWEAEMKRKEAALCGQAEQDLPPVRSKVKKEKPVLVPKKPEKRISSSDYQAWEKFDVDKACEDIDVKEAGPVSLDSKKSQPAKMDKFREEAQYEKEKGNEFVKQEKWDEAIKCYNRAIELINNDPIYYANRGLCYLKKESLHQAETDCTEALRLDPTYVKALQRRATARERLGSLRSASNDLNEVLKLEPNNNHAKRQLEAIKARMGTKGSKSKSSPVSTPTGESKPLITFKFNPTHKIQLSEEQKTVKELSPEEKWRNGVGENITVIKTVKKPPHLRSKRPLKTIPIHELQTGKTAPEKPPTRLKVTEVEDDMAKAETNNNDSKKSGKSQQQVKTYGDGDKNVNQSPESVKLVTEIVKTEKSAKEMTPPANSVQFMAAWKNFKGHDVARSDYLSIIDPSKIPSIFDNSLESDILSEILVILHSNIDKYKKISAYLRGLSGVKRFSALAMFLSSKDKELLNDLLKHCRSIEKCSEEEIADLKSRYEL